VGGSGLFAFPDPFRHGGLPMTQDNKQARVRPVIVLLPPSLRVALD